MRYDTKIRVIKIDDRSCIIKVDTIVSVLLVVLAVDIQNSLLVIFHFSLLKQCSLFDSREAILILNSYFFGISFFEPSSGSLLLSVDFFNIEILLK